MMEKQKNLIQSYQKLLEAMKKLPQDTIKMLESKGLFDPEIIEIRFEHLKLAHKKGMYIFDWLRKQCKLMFSDPNYIKLISEEDRNALLSYHSKLSTCQWCDDKDYLMFHRLRKKYQELVSEKTKPYIS